MTRVYALVVGLLAVMVSGERGWAQSCPQAPSGSRPGWNVLFYNAKAKTGGLITDAAYAAAEVRRFPVKYADIPDMARLGDLPKLVFKGNFLVCEPGHYEFALIIEAGLSRAPRSLLCKGFVQSGTTKLIEIDKPGMTSMIGAGLQRAFTGAMELEKGSTDIAISLLCGAQFYGGRNSVMKSVPNEMLLGGCNSPRKGTE